MGKLFLVATPIGNLEDISLRALRVLKEASLIAVEDTRHTGRLLKHFGIDRPLTSYHEHNKLTKLDAILSALAEGDVALVSDAGTPGLNDPGYELVRAAVQAGFEISPVPGASAPLAALVSSGLPTDAYYYMGYLPRKPAERRRLLASVAELPCTLLALEAPHRLLDALADIQAVLGDRELCLARELTKLHEEFLRGHASAVHSLLTDRPPRGEFTIVIAGKPTTSEPWTEQRIEEAIRAALQAGKKPAQIAGTLAGESNRPRREIYELVMKIREEADHEPG